ncbi:MAG: inositol monophosphatase family protein [Alphaproteobacteria bacterium]|nr:inositol monophosphatase family protein [Alphaproteobacteria bacterium]
MTNKTDYFSRSFHDMADIAADISLKYFRAPLLVETKEDSSPVTIADREIESRLREYIVKNHPIHGIIGEEYGKERADAEFVWVIDPIDGTKSFVSGVPLFGTIIGLLHKGIPVAGLINQPFTKERWFGVTNETCLYNGNPVRVSDAVSMKQARCAVYLSQDLRFFEKLVGTIRYNIDCYSYALLSMGCMDLVVENDLKLHDVAGVVPIVTGAGGIMRCINNAAIDISFTGGGVIAASTESLYREAAEVLKKHEVISYSQV